MRGKDLFVLNFVSSIFSNYYHKKTLTLDPTHDLVFVVYDRHTILDQVNLILDAYWCRNSSLKKSAVYIK